MRICLLTLDLLGPIRNGGIGTAFTALAEALSAEGHDVTILYPASHTETAPLSHWVEDYAARGMRLVCLHASGSEKHLALTAHHWLKREVFDVIHFHEWRGIGHFVTVARRCGLAHANTALVCQMHSPSAWHREHSHHFVSRLAEAEISHMERCSAEGADLVVSPSRYMLEWAAAQGWSFGRTRVQPNLLPCGFRGIEAAPAPIDELVFFGRLEERKGVALFCDAIAAMVAMGRPPERVAFLGKLGEVAGGSALAFIARAAQGWGIPWDLRNDLDVLGARDYLAGPGRLAVIASAIENSPYTVLECLVAGVPFVAPDRGGIAELVAAEDRAAVLVPREADAMARHLAALLGTTPPRARPAFAPAQNRAAWMALQHEAAALAPRPAPRTHAPLVSICMASFNRPVLLAEAIASIEAQTYPNLELVLVDDASTNPDARAFLDSLTPRFAARGWQIIRHAGNRYLGAARNTAVAAARGEWLLFMDDDNLARPDEVEVFVRAALASGAGILTCQMHAFTAQSFGPTRIPEMSNYWIPVGGPVSLGFFENAFGDANFMIRRDLFQSLGGFGEERAAFEDWELLMRAALAGHAIECLPETLFAYRVSHAAMLRSLSASDAHRAHRRVSRAWTEGATHPAMREALMMALDMRIAPRYAAPPDGAALNSAGALQSAAGEALARREVATARNLLTQALRLQPEDEHMPIELLGLGAGDAAALAPLHPGTLGTARRALRRLEEAGDAARAAALEARILAAGLLP